MMTSGVFGTIAATNLGYARVELQKTLAEGCSECRVVVHLANRIDNDTVEAREYFRETSE